MMVKTDRDEFGSLFYGHTMLTDSKVSDCTTFGLLEHYGWVAFTETIKAAYVACFICDNSDILHQISVCTWESKWRISVEWRVGKTFVILLLTWMKITFCIYIGTQNYISGENSRGLWKFMCKTLLPRNFCYLWYSYAMIVQ